MGLLGRGALVICHDVAPEAEADYGEWHSKEHLPERLAVPGFLRGQRGKALWGAPGYINWYEVEALETLSSAPYLARLNAPSPLTRSLGAHIRPGFRTLCAVRRSVGTGVAGFLLSLQITADPDRAAAMHAWLMETVPTLLQQRGVVGAHYLEGDDAASRIETEEKRNRPGKARVAERILLVGGYDAEALHALRQGALAPDALAAQGVRELLQSGLYQTVHALSAADLALPPQ